VMLSRASLATGDEALRTVATGIGRDAAVRRYSATGVRDAGLCHGAAGMSLVFQRLRAATGEHDFAEAARRWVATTLRLRGERDQGVSGFRACEYRGGDVPHWVGRPGLLTGAAGVGLSLLAAATSLDPSWDRCLLMSRRSDRPG
jgi:hypothetical protein